ncbi:MAG: hypothetical protein Salg2KO_12170 [Salibacteraceae bacterium]
MKHKPEIMFGLFKKTSEKEKLQKKYKALMTEAHALSQCDRTAGDKKYKEADDLLKKLEAR